LVEKYEFESNIKNIYTKLRPFTAIETTTLIDATKGFNVTRNPWKHLKRPEKTHFTHFRISAFTHLRIYAFTLKYKYEQVLAVYRPAGTV
jgi:hypothetical protein